MLLRLQGRTCHSALREAVFNIQSCWQSEIHWMNSEWLPTLGCYKYPVYIKYWPQRPQFFVHFALGPVAFEIQGCGKLPMYRITSEWPWTFHSQSTLYTLNIASESPIFANLAVRLAVLEIPGVGNQKCKEIPMTLHIYVSNSTQDSLRSSYPVRFFLRPAVLKIYALSL